MVDFSKAKEGDKFRRIKSAVKDGVEIGDIFTLVNGGIYELKSDRNGIMLGTGVRSAWEKVEIEEEPKLTTQTIDAVELLNKLEELTSQVAKLVAIQKASTTPRLEVIKKAKEEVEYERRRRELLGYPPIKFHVNEKKGAVVAILRLSSGAIIRVGKAKVSRDDKFDVNIGKVIALRRALDKPDLSMYLNAPQR